MFINLLLSIASGVLLALAFPNFNLFWLAWAALVPFFIALGRSESFKQAVFSGLAFSVVFFGINLFWVTSLFRFVKWWVLLSWGSLVLFQSVFMLLFAVSVYALGLLQNKDIHSPHAIIGGTLAARRRSATWVREALFAAGLALVWVFFEWLRALGPFGVTAGDLGYSQVRWIALVQIAALTSVYGVSFIVVFFNGTLAIFLQNRERWQPLLAAVVIVLLTTFYGFFVLGSPVVSARTFSLHDILGNSALTKQLVLIQPNIDQMDKLDQNKLKDILSVHLEMSQQAKQFGPDIIIWPETTIPAYILRDRDILTKIRNLAIYSNAWLILGTPIYRGGKSYNSIISISPAGEVVSRYDKSHLVPFGEYLPFRKVLYPILKNVGYFEQDYTSGSQPRPIKIGKSKIAAAVCFESVFPQDIRNRVKQESAFILLLTNDAWFGSSSALETHLNAGILRAVENRKYFVQVSNTGITAVIDPYGRILKRTKINQREILTFQIPLS